MADIDHSHSLLPSSDIFESAICERPLCYGDLIYLTIEHEGKEYLIEFIDHHQAPRLIPKSHKNLIAYALFQAKEESIDGVGKEKLEEKRLHEKVKPGAKIVLLHLLSLKYLNININAAVDEKFGSRKSLMAPDKGWNLLLYLQSSSTSFKEDLEGSDDVMLQIEHSNGFFNLSADFRTKPPTLYFGCDLHQAWHLHVYTPGKKLQTNNVHYGLPIFFHNKHSGKYLDNQSIAEPVRMSASRNLSALWIVEAPNEFASSAGKKEKFVKLQHFMTGAYFSHTRFLTKEKCDPETLVEFSTMPLTIDQFVSLKIGGEYLKVEHAASSECLKDSILSMIPGVESTLETAFTKEVKNAEHYEFEVIRENEDVVSLAFNIRGIKDDIASYRARIMEAYERKNAGFDADMLGQDEFIANVRCLVKWQDEARKNNLLTDFMEMFLDADLYEDMAVITTYSHLLNPYGLGKDTSHVQLQEAIYRADHFAWKMLEKEDNRKLIEKAPDVWVSILKEMFAGVQSSGHVALLTLQTIMPTYLRMCAVRDIPSETAVDCVCNILNSIKSKFSGPIASLSLESTPLLIWDHAKNPIVFCGKEYTMESVVDLSSILALYIQVACRSVFSDFEKLKDLIFSGEPSEARSIVDKLMVLDGNKALLLTNKGLLTAWGRLLKLNLILKARTKLSDFTVDFATEVVCNPSSFISKRDDLLEYEFQKWRIFQHILSQNDSVSVWKHGIFEYINSCLYSFNFLVNNFLLSPENVIKIVVELYTLLNAYTKNREMLLPSHWSIFEIDSLSELIFDGKKKRYGDIANCFTQTLRTLKTCYGFFQLIEVTDSSPKGSLLLTEQVQKEPKALLLTSITTLLTVIVKNMKDHEYMQDSVELISFLIGAGKEFTEMWKRATVRKILLAQDIAEDLCRNLDTVVCMDVLHSSIYENEISPVRLLSIKQSIAWLITVTETFKRDAEQFSSVLKILTSMNLTNSLLVLFELSNVAKDSELTTLVLTLTMNMCTQYPENKAQVLDHLYKLNFTYELPEYIKLLDMFGFLADMDIHQIQLLTREMVKGYITTKGSHLEALFRLIEAHRSLVPLISISSILLEAIEHWAKDDEDVKEFINVLRRMAALDQRLMHLLSSHTKIAKIISSRGLDGIDRKMPKQKTVFTDKIELINKPSAAAQLKKMKNMVLHKQSLVDFQMKASDLVQTRTIGHLTIIEVLQEAKAISPISESFNGSGNNIEKPMYALALHLFKAIRNNVKTESGEVLISQGTIKTLLTSDMPVIMLRILLRTKSPRHIMLLLKCLRRTMQINCFNIKERILSVLIENKNYFYLFNSFFRLCEQYKADVSKPSSPHFGLMEEYIRFFTAGCDLCNEGFQNFIREQMPDSNTNINLLLTALSIMQSVRLVIEENVKHGKDASIQQQKMISLLIMMITEAISGPNLQNQQVVGASDKLYGSLNTAISLIKIQEGEEQSAFSLMSLLSALLEKDEESDQRDIMKAMANTLDFAALQQLMLKIEAMTEGVTRVAKFRDVAVRICIFLCDFQMKSQECGLENILDGPTKVRVSKEKFLVSKDVSKAVEKYSKFMGSVELEKDDMIYNVLFPIDDSSHYLTAFTKDLLLRTVHQQPLRQEKLDDFLSGVKTCMIEISIQKSRPDWVVKWSPYWLFFSRLSFIFAMVINFLLLYNVRGTHHHDRFYMSEELRIFVSIIEIAQCALYFFSMFLYWNTYYYTLYYPLVAKSVSMDVGEIAINKELNKYRSPFEIESEDISHEQVKALQTTNIVWLAYNLIFVAVSVMSIYYPPMSAILMLGVFSQNERFDTMLRALMTNWQLLGVTALLMCIVIYEFSMLAYLEFYDYYNFQPGLECDDLFNCFISTLNMGLNGGLGGALSEIKEEDYWGRLWFDVTFQIVIMMVFLNIVFGIIIDAFGDLRDERTRIEEDVNNNCIICGRDRSTIDLRGESWKRHVTQIHSYENYLKFMIYIINKPIEDCSGLEKYVKEQIGKNSVSFMPSNSTMLKKTDCEDEAEDEKEDMERQEVMLSSINELIEKFKRSR